MTSIKARGPAHRVDDEGAPKVDRLGGAIDNKDTDIDCDRQLPDVVDIANARLPAAYEEAKVALASCEKIDECQTCANKAEALASYAKMADDDTLRQLADRIQARAVRRMGELLKQFDGKGNNQ